jgi:hypothetical protein
VYIREDGRCGFLQASPGPSVLNLIVRWHYPFMNTFQNPIKPAGVGEVVGSEKFKPIE